MPRYATTSVNENINIALGYPTRQFLARVKMCARRRVKFSLLVDEWLLLSVCCNVMHRSLWKDPPHGLCLCMVHRELGEGDDLFIYIS